MEINPIFNQYFLRQVKITLWTKTMAIITSERFDEELSKYGNFVSNGTIATCDRNYKLKQSVNS